MKTKKTLQSFMVILIIMTLLVGCGGNAVSTNEPTGTPQGEPSVAEAFDTTTPVEIQYWHIFSDGDYKVLNDELVAEFEKLHPNITVKQLGVSFWDYWTKLSTAIAGGSGPDLALNDTSTAQARAKNGVTVNVSPYIARDGINLEDYFPILVNRLKYNDRMYGMPNDTDVRVLFYNKDAFKDAGLDPEKPPTNWAEVEEYADKLTKYNDKGQIAQMGFLPTMGNLGFHTLAWTNGGGFWDKDMNPTFNSPENIETLEWMVRMQQKYTKKALSAFAVQNGALAYSPFIAGKVAMIVDTNNLYVQIDKYAPDLNYGVATIPYQKNMASWSAGFDLEIINNQDKLREQAAWQLMKFMTTKETQMRVHKVAGSLVGNIAAATDPEFMSNPVWATIVDQMQYSRFIEIVDASPSWHGVLQGETGGAINGDISAKEALDAAQTNMENEIKKYKATQ
jgi:multiple sugar transport system substrate-binding protein